MCKNCFSYVLDGKMYNVYEKSRHVLKNIKKKTQRQPKINKEYRGTEAGKKRKK